MGFDNISERENKMEIANNIFIYSQLDAHIKYLENLGFSKTIIDEALAELKQKLLTDLKNDDGAKKEPILEIELHPEVHIEARTNALEFACSLYNTPFYEKRSDVIEIAQRFYTYITKGE